MSPRVEFYASRHPGAAIGEDLCGLPLSMRKASLSRLLARRADGIFLSDFEQTEIGPDLFRHACLMGLEGMVSKHGASLYRGGRFRHWVKIKNPGASGVHAARCGIGFRERVGERRALLTHRDIVMVSPAAPRASPCRRLRPLAYEIMRQRRQPVPARSPLQINRRWGNQPPLGGILGPRCVKPMPPGQHIRPERRCCFQDGTIAEAPLNRP